MTLYFEDFREGQHFAHGGYTISEEAAIAFAREYDPQYFHIDPEAAKHSLFGRLVVSGWQTAAVSMRLKALSGLGQAAGGLIGMGLEDVKWPLPVYPGDTLRVQITVTGLRESSKRPAHGIVQYRIETFNQHDQMVMTAMTAVLVGKR